MGSQGGPLGTHGAMDPGLWGPIGQGTHWPRTWGLRGPGASGDPGPMGPRLVTTGPSLFFVVVFLFVLFLFVSFVFCFVFVCF